MIVYQFDQFVWCIKWICWLLPLLLRVTLLIVLSVGADILVNLFVDSSCNCGDEIANYHLSVNKNTTADKITDAFIHLFLFLFNV